MKIQWTFSAPGQRAERGLNIILEIKSHGDVEVFPRDFPQRERETCVLSVLPLDQHPAFLDFFFFGLIFSFKFGSLRFTFSTFQKKKKKNALTKWNRKKGTRFSVSSMKN